MIILSTLRSEQAVQDSVEQSVKQFGGIDIVINNASAISLTGTQETPMKTFDLMHQVRLVACHEEVNLTECLPSSD